MAEEESLENSEYIRGEMLEELIPRMILSYQALKEISEEQDPLLNLMKIERVDEDTARFVVDDMRQFIKKIGLDETKLPNPKAYSAFKKYHAMMCARIRYRRKTIRDSTVQSLIEYVDLLSQVVNQKHSEYLKFVDFTSHPARILPRFREYAEITREELQEIQNRTGYLDQNEILLSYLIKMTQKEAKRLEERLFIH